jgi:hypothetical protein
MWFEVFPGQGQTGSQADFSSTHREFLATISLGRDPLLQD